MSLLTVRGLVKSFGALQALKGVDLTLETGEVLGVIGPNGSGKTTMFNCMAGVLAPDGGKVVLEGRDITAWPSHRICRAGLVKTDQKDHTFGEMTVKENVLLGAMFGANLGKSPALAKVDQALDLTGLADLREEPAAALTVAMRRRLALARALATGPKVMLLDENLAGLTPSEIDQALGILRRINQEGVSLIVVEHVMRAVLGVCSRVLVLDFGRCIAQGGPQEVMAQPKVATAYLGENLGEGPHA